MITIPGIVSALAASPRSANRLAIRGVDPVTFLELHARAQSRVSELAAASVGGGSIVAVICYNETFAFEYLVACGHLGAALMPLSPALTDRELIALIEKADAAICVVSPAFAMSRLENLRSATGRVCYPVQPPDASPSVAVDLPLPRADSTCWVSTTGGSTGTPRLFAISHERLLTNSMMNALEWGWERYLFHLALSPIAHGIGFSHAVGQLATGGTIALVERYSPEAATRSLGADEVAWTAVVPTMIHDLIEYAKSTGASLAGLGLIVSAGAPLTARLRERALAEHPSRRLIEYYGSTELGWISWIEHRSGDPRTGLVGMPTLGTSIRIVDARGDVLPSGEVGRIEKCGRPYAIPLAGGASAYEANSASWESSEDLGYIDVDGALIVSGRADDVVVVGGQNVYPVEIEHVIREHPLVREVVVCGVDNTRLGQELVAIVEVGPDIPQAFTDKLRAYCTDRLAKYKRPAQIILTDALPRNSAGKISRSFTLSAPTDQENRART